MAAKDRKEQLEYEINLQNQLIASAKTHLALSQKGRDIKNELLDNYKMKQSSAMKLKIFKTQLMTYLKNKLNEVIL